MILAVCLNPALDVTYHVDDVRPGAAHVVERATRRAGGKGTNVARTLHQLGEPVRLLAPVGGPIGSEFAADLAAYGLDAVLVDVAGPTRSTLALPDGTVFNETGSVLAGEDLARVVTAYRQALAEADVVVLSGSLPPGEARYAPLVELARDAGATAVVDTSRGALLEALTARPDVVAPNLHEARVGLELPGADVLSAARGLRERGAVAALVSAGTEGALADTPAGRWSARPPEIVPGNPTGAGDAFSAAVAAGLRAGAGWPQILAAATALAGAAVAVDVAGGYDAAVHERLRRRVVVEAVPAEQTTPGPTGAG